VTLDGTSSIDPDDETQYAWEFTWRCEGVAPAAGACRTAAGDVLELPTSRTSTPTLAGRAYTRALFSSTRAVSDTDCTPNTL
jgi:hypothetical protein